MSELVWTSNVGRGTKSARLENGSVVTVFWLDDLEGIWGEGYGFVATIPGTKRGIHGDGRLPSLDEVVRQATEKVDKALSRKRR